ncbi:MAG: DUF6273 domain-containing protein [Acutalibacter sp.]
MIFNQRVVKLTGARIALSHPGNFTASPGNEQVSLTWEDPGDETSGGQIVAEWEFTRIVRKVGSAPANQNDGVIVLDSTVKNQYMTEPFVDTGLTNGTTYYYGAFACSAAGAWSDGAFAGAIPVAGTPLGDLAEGTLIKIKENGTPVEFYVAKQGYEPTLNGPNRVLMVRKDCYDQRQWNSSNYNVWNESSIYSWLNNTYKKLFADKIKDMIGITAYYYTPGNFEKDVTTTSSSIFLMSMTELGRSNGLYNDEGTPLPIASTLHSARLNGNNIAQWTRSPYTGYQGANYAWALNNGSDTQSLCTQSYGSRPCFTLPTNALVDPDGNLIENADIPPIKTPLGDLAEGTLITINESGAPVEFYVAKQNYEEELNGAGRVLCVRKDVHSDQVWDAESVNAYAESDIDAWFNGTYKNTLSRAVQTMIGTTEFYYTLGNNHNSVSSLERAVFALSLTELGYSHLSANTEGSTLPVVSALQVAYLNGNASSHWTRSPVRNNNSAAWKMTSSGGFGSSGTYSTGGARPAFTLPSTARVSGNLALIEEV